MIHKFRALLLVLPTLCWFAAPAQAGLDTTRTTVGVGRCFPETNPDFNLNITYCQGTMAGIRSQTSDSTRFAYFSMDTSGLAFFTMQVRGVGYSCTAPASMNDLWRTAMSTNGWFSIAFDRTTGVCKVLTITGGSNMKSAL